MSRHYRALTLLALAVAGPAAVAETDAEPPAQLLQVDWPRGFGHTVGDLIELRARLRLAPGWALDRDGLPPLQPDDRLLALRAADWQADPADCADCHRLLLRWQLFKSVRSPQSLSLPAVTLRLRKGQQIAAIDLPAHAIDVVPLAAWQTRRDWGATIRPGFVATPFDVASALWPALAWALAALVCAGGWLFASGRRRFGERPFADAWRAVAALARKPDPALLPAAFAHWHRAFDRSAGRALSSGQLAGWFASHPEFADLQTEVAAVFAASDACFFARDPAPAAGIDTGRLRDLLARLRDREPLGLTPHRPA
ncbi:hypothetical protein [Derxia lacustris]|uniref:hypothetical protein n=1 Tax=Derxia lacustris TaxID=764842 RepID=UPI000A16DE97|nr:hypothetical protein [Derxia lacustris]